MNETFLDNLFASCQRLSDNDLETLFNGIVTERKNRQDREKRDAWQRVVEALLFYIKDYGDVIINDNRDGDGISVFLHYFRDHVEAFNERLTSEPNIANNDIAKAYFANYKQLLKQTE